MRTIEIYGGVFPAKRIVCPHCDGEGTHTNPAIDGDGLTQEEMESGDADFLRSYLSGVYDVRCAGCEGLRVIDDVDEGLCTVAQLRQIKEWKDEEAETRAEEAAERRWRC